MSDQIAAGWSKKTIGDLAEVVSGGTPARDVPAFWDQGTIPWVTPTDITGTDGRYLDDSSGKITSLGLAWSGANMLPTGTVLMTSRATVGEAKIAAVPCCTNQGFKSLIPKRDVDSLFLYYLTQLHKEGIKVFGSGSTFLEVGKADILRFSVTVPGFTQQKEISRILDSVDGAIEKTEALIAKYQQIKAGLMHDLFTRGIKDRNLREAIAESPDLYKKSMLGAIPTQWSVGDLRSKAHPSRPHLQTVPFGSSLKGEHWVEEGCPIVTIGSLGDGQFINKNLLFVSEETARKLGGFALVPGDVVFSRVADVGRSVAVTEEQRGWIMSSNLMRIMLDPAKVIPRFLQQSLSYDCRVRQQVRSLVNSGGREVANGAVLNKMQFAWPGIEEQGEIVQRSDALDQVITVEHQRMEIMSQAKLGLSSDLLGGLASHGSHNWSLGT